MLIESMRLGQRTCRAKASAGSFMLLRKSWSAPLRDRPLFLVVSISKVTLVSSKVVSRYMLAQVPVTDTRRSER